MRVSQTATARRPLVLVASEGQPGQGGVFVAVEADVADVAAGVEAAAGWTLRRVQVQVIVRFVRPRPECERVSVRVHG